MVVTKIKIAEFSPVRDLIFIENVTQSQLSPIGTQY